MAAEWRSETPALLGRWIDGDGPAPVDEPGECDVHLTAAEVVERLDAEDRQRAERERAERERAERRARLLAEIREGLGR